MTKVLALLLSMNFLAVQAYSDGPFQPASLHPEQGSTWPPPPPTGN